jgi:RNA polymerase-binding transcription factor DksA
MEPGPDLSILDDLEVELRDVEHALHRLEEGTYGVCEVCGEQIGDARLEANPVARICRDDHMG